MSEPSIGVRELMAEMNIGADGDDWGLCLSWHFAVCDVLYHMNEDIPAEWQYRHGLGCTGEDDDYQTAVTRDMVDDGTVSVKDLIDFGQFLNAWADELRERGESY